MDDNTLVQAEEYTYKCLDSIDFIPYLKKYNGKDIHKLITKLENDYNNTEMTNNELLEGFLFNVIGDYELKEYLRKRYPEFDTVLVSVEIIHYY